MDQEERGLRTIIGCRPRRKTMDSSDLAYSKDTEFEEEFVCDDCGENVIEEPLNINGHGQYCSKCIDGMIESDMSSAFTGSGKVAK